MQCLPCDSSGLSPAVSFEVKGTREDALAVLGRVRLFAVAESLGGVQSLITFPAVQTHADIAPDIRERLGINNRLLRLSVGIENVDDLRQDLERVLE